MKIFFSLLICVLCLINSVCSDNPVIWAYMMNNRQVYSYNMKTAEWKLKFNLKLTTEWRLDRVQRLLYGVDLTGRFLSISVDENNTISNVFSKHGPVLRKIVENMKSFVVHDGNLIYTRINELQTFDLNNGKNVAMKAKIFNVHLINVDSYEGETYVYLHKAATPLFDDLVRCSLDGSKQQSLRRLSKGIAPHQVHGNFFTFIQDDHHKIKKIKTGQTSTFFVRLSFYREGLAYLSEGYFYYLPGSLPPGLKERIKPLSPVRLKPHDGLEWLVVVDPMSKQNGTTELFQGEHHTINATDSLNVTYIGSNFETETINNSYEKIYNETFESETSDKSIEIVIFACIMSIMLVATIALGTATCINSHKARTTEHTYDPTDNTSDDARYSSFYLDVLP